MGPPERRGRSRARVTRPRRLVAWLVLLLLIAAAPSVDGYGGRAQGDGAPADDGFRLVARILPGEWIELADVGGVPTAAAPDAGDPATPSPVTETLSGAALVEALRGGGHVIYFRHAATDFSQQDTNRQNLADCASQRNLDDAGRADARRIGEGFAALGIPVGQVLSSEYCRTRETAELAFGRVTPTIDLTSVFAAAETDDDEARIAALRRLLATPPEPGTNTVLVGHQANLADAAGVVIAEGEAAIFLPLPTEEGVATSATDDA